MKLEGLPNVKSLNFDLPNRTLEVHHTDNHANIFAALDVLRFDTRLVSSEQTEDSGIFNGGHARERKVLWQVLAINLFFFMLELLAGFTADSMGLIADSLDMLADSIVYGMSLFAVGGAISRKKNIARAAGYLQLALAVLGFVEVIRRFAGYGETPDFHLMIIISFFALTGNAICLYLLQKSRSREAHMRASMIFTSMDVVVNIGVVIAGVLVYFTASKYPDLMVGTIVFILVGRGAYRILQLSGAGKLRT